PPPPPSPAGDGKKPDGKPAAFVTEFLVLDPIPAKAQPSVFVRLPRDIDPNTVAVDLSALTSPLVRLSGRHTWFRGFEVRHGASYQQRALVDASAPGALLEGCRIHDGEVRGIALSAKSEPDQPPLIIRGNHVARTGHLGIGGIGNSAAEASAENQAAPAAVAAIIEHNLVEDTNWAGYSQLWESGGIKLLRLVGAQIRFNHIRRSGLGIWLDWENYGNRIESNLFEDTAAFAIGIEASPGPNLAANNIVLGLSPGPVWFRAGLLTWDGTRTQFIHNLVDTRGLAGTRWQGGDTAYGYSHGNNTTTRRTRWCPLPPPRQMTFLNNVSLGARNAIVTRAVETLNAGNATDHGRGAKPLPGLQSLPLGAPGDYAARLAAVAPAAASHPQADAVTFDYFGLPRHAPGVPAIAGPFRAPLPPPPAASVLEIEFSDTTITRHEY
ncbi:MAG: right-handed parallel beta-helix repeat-containing protein, partial [Opitutaceae bacterium]|nr:right-handed parallel beta-helix repeat-containing protein [Opitutaceae bacterium]